MGKKGMVSKEYYQQCLDTMFSFRRFGIKLGLETITALLAGVDDPQKKFKTVHVAGTNGKGSIASTLSAIFHLAGFDAGLYTSPHLVRFNERICINDRPVTDDAVIEAYERLNALPKGERESTFFEFTTAMAFHIFAQSEVDWAVIETGMGGRLDATNILQPELSIISNISLEHQEYLGNSIEEIAGEKGGIIKENTPVITGVNQPEAIQKLTQIAEEKSAPLYLLNRDFHIERTENQTFTYVGMENRWPDLHIGMAGDYQYDNAALVLAACEVLNQRETDIGLKDIRQGLAQNRWPGRLEIVSESPFVILDGAHNLAAAEHLTRFLKNDLADKKITLIIGILDDKPFEDILKLLLSAADKVILCQPQIYRSLSTDALLPVAQKYHNKITCIPDVNDALSQALEKTPDDEVICVAGSLYMVGEAKTFFEAKGHPSFNRRI